jgi:hypothetical protein
MVHSGRKTFKTVVLISIATLAFVLVASLVLVACYTIVRFERIGDQIVPILDQLEHANMDVRIQGIQSLERFANENKSYYDHGIGMLTLFIRERAPLGANAANNSDNPELAEDIQTALAILARQPWNPSSEAQPFFLSETDLRGASLKNAQLKQAYFADSILDAADMRNAQLESARLRKTSLQKANLTGADLRHAHVTDADFTGANLSSANLQWAYLRGVTLNGAILDSANLEGADFAYAEGLNQIKSIKGATGAICGAPDDFVEWANERGAALTALDEEACESPPRPNQ